MNCSSPFRINCGRSYLKILVGIIALLLIAGCLVLALIWILLNRVPKHYPAVSEPIEKTEALPTTDQDLDGFASPYLGHTGSWDGKGGGIFGSSKIPDLEVEKSMGLRWTFMPVHWRELEPEGPVDLTAQIPAAWKALDHFIIAAHDRKLNVLMQAPVIGGNAGGPPAWVGRREKGKSAPANMEAAAVFAAKLAARYAPGGHLAIQEGWGNRYGVRAWELDNEPDGYRTHWKNQAADYAEFVTKVARAIRTVDAKAVIVGPSIMGSGARWIEGALDAHGLSGSPTFRGLKTPYSIGPQLDVISFHAYEGLDSALSSTDRTIETVLSEVRDVFTKWENRSLGFNYSRKSQYWHTEGNFDFFGVLSKERRAAWRIQFFTRAFAAGIRKVNVMDPSKQEQQAVRAYVEALPNPFPMQRADSLVSVHKGNPVVYRHLDQDGLHAGSVWIAWPTANTGDAELEVPVVQELIKQVTVDGITRTIHPTNRAVRVHLTGDTKMAPPVLLLDRN